MGLFSAAGGGGDGGGGDDEGEGCVSVAVVTSDLSPQLINNLSVDDDLRLSKGEELEVGPTILSLVVRAKKLLSSIS